MLETQTLALSLNIQLPSLSDIPSRMVFPLATLVPIPDEED